MVKRAPNPHSLGPITLAALAALAAGPLYACPDQRTHAAQPADPASPRVASSTLMKFVLWDWAEIINLSGAVAITPAGKRALNSGQKYAEQVRFRNRSRQARQRAEKAAMRDERHSRKWYLERMRKIEATRK